MKVLSKIATVQAKRILPPLLGGDSKDWSALYGKQLAKEECTELRDNLSGFFDTLNEWNTR